MKLTAEKNKKQRSSYLPISIGWVLKIVLIIVGYSLWGGAGFIWALVGLYLFYDVIRGYSFVPADVGCCNYPYLSNADLFIIH